MSALLINDVPIECINQAAVNYYVPAALIISVLRTEGGRNGMAKPNKNGSFDYGPMQINTLWLDKIKPFGYTVHDLQFNPCKNVAVGAWILSQSIANATNFGTGVGDYHSHTLPLNQRYRVKVVQHYKLINSVINTQ
jgi:hypothetical protein